MSRRAPTMRTRPSPARRQPPVPTPARGDSREEELATISLEGVSRSFIIDGRPLPVLDSVTLRVPDREIVAIVGPNGSGKSTLLRLMAGLLAPDDGRVELDGKPVSEADPRLGLVFQEPRLLPWRRALDNVAFPLELAGHDRRTRGETARALLDLVGLTAFAEAYPHQLSGGMRQRLAIARALARDPSVLLLDEPFSALDALTRERFNLELLELWSRTGTTIVLVTPNIPEAVFVSDRVIVLSPRPAHVVAEVPVEIARPRSLAALDGAAFSRTAATIRAHLAAGDSEHGANQQLAAPVHDVLERAGTPAWFDPFRDES
jgi:NitT/TauT family transport system ATP-binding protein